MNFFHVSIGGGITGIETVISIINQIKKNLKKKHTKKITLAIIEKNPENIPGGIAYGFERSKFGYFNNHYGSTSKFLIVVFEFRKFPTNKLMKK